LGNFIVNSDLPHVAFISLSDETLYLRNSDIFPELETRKKALKTVDGLVHLSMLLPFLLILSVELPSLDVM